MSATAWAVVTALVAAALYGAASALQHQQAREVETDASPGLLVTLAQRPLWLLGIGCDFGAIGMQAVALALGSVALVQVLLVSGLPLAALMSAALHRRRLFRFELYGVLLCSAGLALLAPALASEPSTQPPDRQAAVVAAIVIGVGASVLMGLRNRPRFGPACAGAGSGMLFGAGSVLLAVTATRFANHEPVFTTLAPYAAVAVGGIALLSTQIAFQTGELGAPLAALSLTEPVVAVVLAVTVLHESLPTSGWRLAATVVGSVLAVIGVLVLSPGEAPADGHQHQGPTARPEEAEGRSA